jgi:amphi-Trp domain-containing protein
MSSEKEKLKAKGVVEVREAVAYLRTLTDLVGKGQVAVQSGGKTMVVDLPKFVKLEVEVEEKGDKQELSIEISWKEGLSGAAGMDLKIKSPDEPDVKECLPTEQPAQQQSDCAEV